MLPQEEREHRRGRERLGDVGVDEEAPPDGIVERGELEGLGVALARVRLEALRILEGAHEEGVRRRRVEGLLPQGRDRFFEGGPEGVKVGRAGVAGEDHALLDELAREGPAELLPDGLDGVGLGAEENEEQRAGLDVQSAPS